MPSEIKNPAAAYEAHGLLWLNTRDGSPTLWNDEISEGYRSLKGAFTESYWAFVRPALESAKIKSTKRSPVRIGEFGLGLGTNWLLWNQLAAEAGLSFQYLAIERDLATFQLGLDRWKNEFSLFQKFAAKLGIEIAEADYLQRLEAPEIQIFSSPQELAASARDLDLWLHDPFGAEVNPEGYTPETLRILEPSFSPELQGFSYACNRAFQEALKALEMQIEIKDFEESTGKRSRLEFRRAAATTDKA